MLNRVIDFDDFFYSRSQYLNWEITDKIISAMKELKSSYYEGGYVEKGIHWLVESNFDVLDKYRGNIDRNAFMSHIGVSMQLLTRTVRMSDVVSYNSEIHNYHIELINRLYIDHDIQDNAIYTADKRPFGNSFIEGDIFDHYLKDEYERANEEDKDMEFRDIHRNDSDRVYNEVLELAKFIIQTCPIRFRNFTYYGYDKDKLNKSQLEYYNHSWAPSVSEFRDLKISEILS